MKYALAVLLGFYLSLASSSAQQLVPLNTENTGESSTGTAITGGSTDPYYNYVLFYPADSAHTGTTPTGTGTYGPTSPAIVTIPGDNPSVWANSNGTSSPVAQWIAPSSNQDALVNPPGVYVYQLTLNSVTNGEHLAVSGEIAADNYYEIAYSGTASAVSGATVEVPAPSGTGYVTAGNTISSSNNYGFGTGNVAGSGVAASEYASLTNFSFTLTSTGTGTEYLDFLVLNEDPGSSGGDNQTGLYVTDFEVYTVPEPSTWAIILLGLGGVAFARYRAQRVSPAVATELRAS